MIKHLLPGSGNFYKANLHCHTTISDGRKTPEEVRRIYKEQGYSVVAFTDHDVFIPHPELAEDIPALVPQMIDADMAYMHEAGVLDDDGYAGDAYYEDDEAIEYIVESLAAKNALDPEQAVKLAALVDDYLDAQQMFLESQGMVEYD